MRFDGRTARGEVVLVRLEGDALVVLARDTLDRVPLANVGMAEPFEHAPRMLALPGGCTIEAPDPDRSLPAALALAGKGPSWIVRFQRAWTAVVVALALLVAGGSWAYVEGLPIAARRLAQALPASFEHRMGENVLSLLDASTLKPSALPHERRARIAERFRQASAVIAPGVPVEIEFRSGQVNAFALPGGIIVVFDELVALADDDERVLGVLGHELGHVVHRHSTRQLLQALGLAAVAGVVWGDFSSVAANVPLVLGAMRYGRAFEVEADEFGLDFLKANGLSPRPLLEFFMRAEEAHGDTRRSGAIPEFLSTHPSSASRIERLRREAEAFESAPRR